MSLNFLDHRETIAKNLVTFIRMKGYSKLTFSKLSGISRITIDRIMKGGSFESEQYNRQIEKINKAFDLPNNYFINPSFLQPSTTYTAQMIPWVQREIHKLKNYWMDWIIFLTFIHCT